MLEETLALMGATRLASGIFQQPRPALVFQQPWYASPLPLERNVL